MTVGAVVLSDTEEEALADAAGRLAVRRIVESAWAGGAMPIIVVVPDVDGRVVAALKGSPAVIIDPRGATGVGAARRGVRAGLQAVRETSAILLWPGRMTWTDPETVTSLIEAHGRSGDRVIRPLRAGQVGWPVLLPAAGALELLGEGRRSPGEGRGSLDEAVAAMAAITVEMGDPGSVLGREVDLGDLPDYTGPPEPVGGPPPEWGAAAAETPDLEV